MLVNLSNHPSNKWCEKQLKAAKRKYGAVFDIPFPIISPYASKTQVHKKAKIYFDRCLKILSNSKTKNNAIHIMGESTFTFALVNMLKSKNVKCVASTTTRNVVENKASRTYFFSFVKFREY